MRTFIDRGFVLLLLAGALLAARPALAQEESALDIIRKADELTRGDTQSGTYYMTIVRPDWQRTMVFEYWSEGTNKSFIRIKEPVKERGVTFLKIGREMWQYVPRINRVIKIPPSMMLQSWMGSDFTNDDLVKESSIVDDYTHVLLGREVMEEGEAYKVELTPKPKAPVAWDRLIEWIRVGDYMPLRAEFYDAKGERTKVFTADPARFERVQGIWMARSVRMQRLRDGVESELWVRSIEIDGDVSEDVFAPANLADEF